MSDLISRQDAIDAINELHDKPNAWLDLAVEALEKLPSAQSGQRWIPCSERLPDVGKDVLVSVDTADSGNCWVTIAYMCYDLTDNEYWFQNEEMNFDMDEVIAWMPLPDAYEEDD